MVWKENGNVGIGKANPANKLDVVGTIRTEEVIVATGWADFVFEEDYVRMDLNAIEDYIKQEGHLPYIPTEPEVKANGIGLGELQVKLLRKIEELTSYLIDQNREMEEQHTRQIRQNKQISRMQEELDQLRRKVSSGTDSMM